MPRACATVDDGSDCGSCTTTATSVVDVSPAIVMLPDAGRDRPAIRPRRVDLPAPFAPMRE
jgi:hypothetical protein